MSNSHIPRKSSISRLLLRAFLILICCFFLLLAFLPTLLSSTWGKEKLISQINEIIPGKIKIENLSLSWFGPQKIQGVTLLDPQNNHVASFETMNTNASLFALAAHPTTAGLIELKSLSANIIGDGEGNTNLMRALDKRCCTRELKPEHPVSISLQNTNGAINLSEKGPIAIHLSGETKQNNLKGEFLVDAEMRGISLQEMIHSNHDLVSLLKSRSDAELKFNTDIANFPVELLDQIVSLRSPDLAGVITGILGRELNLKVDQKVIANGISLNIQANSPTLTAQADLLVDKVISLMEPSQINIKISPAVVDQLMSLGKITPSWHPVSPIIARLKLTKLQLPLIALKMPLKEIDIDSIGLKADLNLEDALFTGKQTKEQWALNGFKATVSTEANSLLADVVISSEVSHQDNPAKINLNLSIPKKTLIKDFSKIALKDIAINGSITDGPLFILDAFMGSSIPFSSIVGSHADLVFSISEQNNTALATMQFKSKQLDIPSLSLLIDDSLKLQKPVHIVLQLNQNQVNHIFNDSKVVIQGPATAQVTLNSFSIPLSDFSSSYKMAHKLDLDVQVKMTSTRLLNVPVIGAVSLNDFNLRLLASPKKRPELNASFNLQPDGPSALANIIGKKATFKTSATVGIGFNGKPTANVFNFQMVSDLARLEMSGEMHEGNSVFLNSPTTLSYTFTAAGLQSMGITTDNYLLKHGSPLEMTLDSSHIPLDFSDLSVLQLNGKLKVNDLQLMPKTQKNSSLAVIDNLYANWSIDGEKKLMSLDFKGITRLGENQAAGKIDGTIAINQWLKNGSVDLTQAIVKVNANASKLPTELISALSGQKELVPILGNAIDLSIEANAPLASSEKGTVALDIKSENLSGEIGLQLGNLIQLNSHRPAEFVLKLTPQSYAALRRRINANYAGDFTLTESTSATLKLHSLSLPRSQSLLQAGIEGEFSLGRLAGVDTKTQNKMILNSIHGKVTSKSLREKIDFNMSAQGHNEQGNASAWNLIGSLTHGFSNDGSLNKQDLSLALDATVDSLPIPLFCQFACLNPKLKQQIEAILGPTLDAKIKAKLQSMNGPLYVDVKGSNGHLTLDAFLNEGVLTLNHDLTAQLTATPELSEYVLKDLIPVISGILNADRPINLIINKEGFAFPIRNPSLMSVTIGNATLDMGKVRFSSQSQIAKVLSLLTTASSDLIVWMTPAYFSLNQGDLKLQRVDMLISDRYPIAAWGDVDIGRNRINMVVGLSGSAINKAFNVPGISNSYLLQLPLKGKLNQASIDKTKAIARISALVAQSQGGPQGLVLGTVLDIATGGLAEPAIPSPTTNPLPWNDMLKDNISSDPNGNADGKPKKNPIEEIGKEASSLLKKIFK